MVEYDVIECEHWILTEEGREIADHGSHEVKVFNLIPSGVEGLPVSEVQVKD